jgi:Putative transposase
VRFRYKDYREDDDQQKTMRVTASEFIRRFLLHVLPRGFQRIRYYGFLGNRARRQKVAQCRKLLAMPAPPASLDKTKAPNDYRDRYEALTGLSLRICPRCQDGQMLVIEHLGVARCGAPILDTS